MRSYAERRALTQENLRMLDRARALVAAIPDEMVTGPHLDELRCHELARAIRDLLAPSDLVVVDGKCGPFEHSWLVVPATGLVLDVYAIGRLPQVQLVDSLAAMWLYKPGEARRDIQELRVWAIVDYLGRRMPA